MTHYGICVLAAPARAAKRCTTTCPAGTAGHERYSESEQEMNPHLLLGDVIRHSCICAYAKPVHKRQQVSFCELGRRFSLPLPQQKLCWHEGRAGLHGGHFRAAPGGVLVHIQPVAFDDHQPCRSEVFLSDAGLHSRLKTLRILRAASTISDTLSESICPYGH